MYDQLKLAFLTLDQYHDLVASGVFALAIVAWRGSTTVRRLFASTRLVHCATILGPTVIAAYVAAIIVYLAYPNYYDHLQPTVVGIAWSATHGQPLYPDWTKEGAYGLLYGPLTYLVNGAFLNIHPTIAISKLAGVIPLLIAFILTCFLLTRQSTDRRLSLLLISLFILLLAPYGIFSTDGIFAYLNRSDSFLILVSLVTMLAALQLNGILAAATVGVLAGISADFKLHGLVYAVPPALYILAQQRLFGHRLVLFLVGATGATTAFLIPFVNNANDLSGYRRYLELAVHHGFSVYLLRDNVLFALILLAPAGLLWFWYRPPLKPEERWLLIGIAGAIGLAALIGSKQMAGPHHLLPFVPGCLYAALIVLKAGQERQIMPLSAVNAGAIALLLLLLAYAPGCLRGSVFMAKNLQSLGLEKEKIAEFDLLLNTYPDAEMGVSDFEHYNSTYYRVNALFRGGTLHVDFGAWADLASGGAEEQDIIRFVTNCKVRVWILPIGPPFIMDNAYSGRPLLSDGFRDTFAANYNVVYEGRYYHVWRCRASDAAYVQ